MSFSLQTGGTILSVPSLVVNLVHEDKPSFEDEDWRMISGVCGRLFLATTTCTLSTLAYRDEYRSMIWNASVVDINMFARQFGELLWCCVADWFIHREPFIGRGRQVKSKRKSKISPHPQCGLFSSPPALKGLFASLSLLHPIEYWMSNVVFLVFSAVHVSF